MGAHPDAGHPAGRPTAKGVPRVPPGQRLTARWPLLHVGAVPRFDPSTWDLRIEGEVERPARLSWPQFQELPHVARVWDFHCVTSWSRQDLSWEGVPWHHVEKLVRPTALARHLVFECENDYTANIPLEVARRDDILLADRVDGGPLPPDHGGPLRPVVPSLYGWKSAKWLRRIRFVHEDEPGYWEVRGYSNTADPWTEDRYS